MRDELSKTDANDNESGSGLAAKSACRYLLQFDQSVREFHSYQLTPGERSFVMRLLVLGGIKQLYWLALGEGAVNSARKIGDWWEEVARPMRLHL